MTERKKTGPKGPTKPMDDKTYDQLVAMIRIQCTREEICAVLNMSKDTINRRLKARGELNFETLFNQKRGEGKASLRRSQWLAATDKLNPTMLVWLGKQMLGQSDNPGDTTTALDKAQEIRDAIKQMNDQDNAH